MDNMSDNPSLESDRIALTVPANLIAQIDAQVGGEFVDREDFIRSAVRHYLECMQKSQNETAAANAG
jgi:metal-responsive CopG/Arc/MetJ family transcriptional regulator